MPRSLLVVDDDPAFRDLVARIAKGWGYVVMGEAASVAEALARAAELRPHVALVDIGLPDGDGFSLTAQLVAMPWLVRVVLISVDDDRAYASAARRAGASGFLAKDELTGDVLRQLIEGG
jgi:DNA-binding NarL/FixJ family response regulator